MFVSFICFFFVYFFYCFTFSDVFCYIPLILCRTQINHARKSSRAASLKHVISYKIALAASYWNTTPSFGQPPPTRRSKNTARHVRPSCVRRGWSDRLECTRQRSAPSRSQHRQLRSPTEDALVSAVFGALSAFEAPCDNAPCK